MFFKKMFIMGSLILIMIIGILGLYLAATGGLKFRKKKTEDDKVKKIETTEKNDE